MHEAWWISMGLKKLDPTNSLAHIGDGGRSKQSHNDWSTS
jgi:hypothetical protein